MMASTRNDPYSKADRLASVIGAITALGTYKFYKLNFAEWADRISGPTRSAQYWESIFRDRPEFFRINSTENMVSLVWRRQKAKTYNVDSQSEITPREFRELADAEKLRISRPPLAPAEITALIELAVRLHDSALERQKASRWWIPVAAAILGFIGATLGAWLPK